MDIEGIIRPEVLGSRLKNARLNARMTQDAASIATGIARTTIASIESGKRFADIRQIRAFTQLYKVSEGELLGGDQQPLDLVVKFRSTQSLRSQESESTVANTLIRLASGTIKLEKLVSPTAFSQDLPIVRLNASESIEQQAEDAALLLRQRLGIGVGPISNLFALMESELGFRVFERPLPSGVSGAVAYDASNGAFVILNSLHPRTRRRQTAAHEIAHPLQRKAGVSVLFADEELDEREERFSDAFGRSLLTPASSVRRKYAELKSISGRFTVRHLLVMALHFEVSMEAMCRRLEGLKLVSKGMYELLKEDKLGLRHLEVVKAELHIEDEPSYFTPRAYLLASLAVERELLSVEQVSSMLDLDVVTARKLVGGLASGDLDLLEPIVQ